MSMVRCLFLTLAVLLLCVGDASAQSPAEKQAAAEKGFAGMSFGVGLSFTWDVVDRERVDEAVIDANGIVRVNKKSNALPRIMLESHIFPWLFRDKMVGLGPFVAVQPGSNEIINALGAGVMVGIRRSTDSEQSFNLGFGYVVDPSSKVLGVEFVEDMPAPVGPDGKPLPIRYQTRDQGGFLFFASFSWK